MRTLRIALLLAALLPFTAAAQVYSPKVLIKGQPDATNLSQLTRDIYAQSGARTPRERAEAIWRFFNTDGRFVKPGFWYHIAGWAYEEPMGEVLDPLKLLNSYGFGLCYQIAPVLEAVFKAGGFEDARVWFLTGHTVTEVFYDGAYHYYDSDMMGYNTIGKGPVKEMPVASVHQIEQDGSIILSKLAGPRDTIRSLVDDPWYPADVRDAAIGGLAELFTTRSDNHLFPFQRFPSGHSMDFTLRPGERLVRWFEPHPDGAYYLPHKFTAAGWQEFPRAIRSYKIRTEDGPHSQKDNRRWATGLLEYHPPLGPRLFEVRSPWVIIDASFDVEIKLAQGETFTAETSTDGGRTWVGAGTLRGPHTGRWKTEPAIVVTTEHGRRTAVTGQYAYLVRFTGAPAISDVVLSTQIQVNPRTLPGLAPGTNELVYSTGPRTIRRTIPVSRDNAPGVRYASENGQGWWMPSGNAPAELVFPVKAQDGPIAAFEAGGRFLDLSTGLAPDKLTAEVRKVPAGMAPQGTKRAGSIAWARSPQGPFQTVWEYDPVLKWKDGQPIDRGLCWPEVDRRITAVPPGTREIFVRYRLEGMALDDVRLAVETAAPASASELQITHYWRENDVKKRQFEHFSTPNARYSINIPSGASVVNEAIEIACPR